MIGMALARDTVMGTSMEVVSVRRDRLVAAKAAADRVTAAIDQSWRLSALPVTLLAKSMCTSQARPASPASVPQTA